MKPRLIARLAVFIFCASLAGCNMPGFEPSVEPLDIPEAPPPPSFGQVEPEEAPPELEPEAPPPEEFEPVPFEPGLVPLCTSTYVYVRSSPEKPLGEDNSLELLAPGTQVTWTGNEAQGLAEGEMLTWYEIETQSGLTGWSATDYLAEGECGAVVGQVGLGIVNSPSTAGGNLWGPSEYHYGVDVHPSAGDYDLYSPYDGTVVATDGCAACLEADPTSGQVPDDYSEEYNYGYGAMIITEYRYDDLTQDQRDSLDSAGVEFGPGESLYLMTGHLNPNAAIAVPGTDTDAGQSMATLGTSGNSSGIHGHFDAAVTTSGLRPDQDETINDFWIGSVVGVADYREQGTRVDPTPLFDLP